MEIRLLTSAEDLAAYDRWVKGHPHGTLWQSLEWKTFQEALGREVRIYAGLEGDRIVGSALVVIDRTAFGLSTWDIPRGPLGNEEMPNAKFEMINAIILDAKMSGCLCLYLSPSSSFPMVHILSPQVSHFAFPIRASARHEQPEATRVIDLTLPEDQILAQMKPKGRYNISVARKNGVRVEESKDVAAFVHLVRQTAGRDGFTALPEATYRAFLGHLPGSFLLLAYHPSQRQTQTFPSPSGGGVRGEGEAIAALMGVIWNGRGIYYYGASDYAYRPAMAPYLLQWEAMRLCRAKGCTSYDLLGIAPPGTGSDHPWAGISGFKEKFGGTVVTYPEEQQIVLRPLIHALIRMKRRSLG